MQNNIKLLSAAIALALSSTVVIADDNTDDKSKDNVVTIVSQKRTQDEVTVPISVSSINEEELQYSGATDLNDLSNLAPNFSTNGLEGYQGAIYMRGVGTWSRNIGFDTRVGVYLDGVYLGQSSAINQAMMGLAQAEVVRGPQGTLFGKNTVAGAVNLISIKPNTSELEGQVGVELGNFNMRQYNARVNVPINETTAIQVTALDTEQQGEYFNLFSQERVGDRNYKAARFQLTTTLFDVIDTYFSFDDASSDGTWLNGEALTDTFGQYPTASDPILNQAAGPLVGQIVKPYIIMSDVTPSNGYDNKGYNLTLEYETDAGATVRWITAQRDSQAEFVSDTDYAPVNFLYVDYLDKYDTTTNEFQYISADNEEFEYLAGLYIYDQEGATVRDAVPGSDIAILNAAFGLPCIGEVDITNPLSYCLEADKIVFNRGTVEASSWAAYTNMSLQLAENTHIDFGLRYTKESKSADYTLGTEDGGVNGIIFGVANGTVDNTFDDKFLSHSLGVRTVIGENNFYVKWSTGFKSGGYNLDFIDQFALSQNARFDKETVNSYEAGMKGRYLDGDMNFAAAVFYTDYEDYQVNQFLPLGDNASTISIQNVPEAITKGIELSVDMRFNDNLSADFNYGYLEATFGDFPGGGRRLPDGSNDDATGNTLPFAPKNTLSTTVQYQTQVGQDAMFVAILGLQYNGKQFSNTWNSTTHTTGVVNPANGQFIPTGTIPFGLIDKHYLYNARLGLVSVNGDWDVFVWGKNLDGASFNQDSYRDFFNTYVERKYDQRTYGVELNYYF
jgi:iron complex outermembrane receptor protein